jgi:hypothetical protein
VFLKIINPYSLKIVDYLKAAKLRWSRHKSGVFLKCGKQVVTLPDGGGYSEKLGEEIG